MRPQHATHSLYALSAMAALVTSCAAPQQTLNPQASAQLAHVFTGYWTYAIVHSFDNPGGRDPYRGVLVYKRNFYGTLSQGGVSGGERGLGTIYEVETNGREHVLHYFLPGSSGAGAHPYGDLTEFNGTLYGTTASGGDESDCSGGCGTIFSISPSGAEFQTLHQFTGTDGGSPSTHLTVLNGTLYGTTSSWGAKHLGTVFAVTPSGGFKKLHDFTGKDGAYPSGPLAVLNGKLYGTTSLGGSDGAGAVFSITADGSEHVLHSCKKEPDCDNPIGGLTPLNGKLYGNSLGGGSGGQGSVFAVTTAGKEKVLYSFPSSGSGNGPGGPLTAHDDILYGTTTQGGGYKGGIVFSVRLKGSFQALYHLNSRFAETPSALTYSGGKLYGTLAYGGHSGSGVLYSLTP
jgi:uncharacterized repeat protein (TIGR03803 family)